MHEVPAGHVPAVVTYLQMASAQMTAAKPFPLGVTATEENLDVAAYRNLFRAVGAPWLWSSRLVMPEDELQAILQSDQTELWVIRHESKAIGIVELSFQDDGDCELDYFGIVTSATGQGLGGPMMHLAQTQAFSRQINRFFVHTCNWDDPRALDFYQKAGFKPYKIAVEVFPDPRVDGIHDRRIAPHVPLIE
ncbi:GNAT family N-acetyltransferase [Yoonia litorea]|nr:GNAT family N-acetyltransferase [Yoonia litorea]